MISRFFYWKKKCFVPNIGPKPNDLGYQFGYLKASTNLMTVNLFVMPYNYPILFQLISKLLKKIILLYRKSSYNPHEELLIAQ